MSFREFTIGIRNIFTQTFSSVMIVYAMLKEKLLIVAYSMGTHIT